MLDLIVLGIVQGLTEFLPVSSTAHLLFAEYFLGIRRPGLLLEGVLHLGTALAAVVLFWPDVTAIGRAGARWVARRMRPAGGAEQRASLPDPYLRTASAILVATVITAGLGLAFESRFAQMFDITTPAGVRAVAVQLLITGVLLLWRHERGTRGVLDASLTDGVVIGLAQTVAIIPGISRSGVTIVAGLMLGMRRAEAARLSFLVGIPAIIGAGVLTLKDAGEAAALGYASSALMLGFVVSAVVGAGAIRWLLHIVRQGRLAAFAAYCLVVGLAVLATVRS